jgi:hypothetical protein
MIFHSRDVLESDGEAPTLNVDVVGFLPGVRWAQRKGYSSVGVSGLMPWVQQTYPPRESERHGPNGSAGSQRSGAGLRNSSAMTPMPPASHSTLFIWSSLAPLHRTSSHTVAATATHVRGGDAGHTYAWRDQRHLRLASRSLHDRQPVPMHPPRSSAVAWPLWPATRTRRGP